MDALENPTVLAATVNLYEWDSGTFLSWPQQRYEKHNLEILKELVIRLLLNRVQEAGLRVVQ